MAKKTRSRNRPNFSLAFSAKRKRGVYDRGPYIGLWSREGSVMASGSVSGERLEDLVAFLRRQAERDRQVYVSLFGRRGADEREDEEDDDEHDDEDDDEDEDGEDDEEDDEDEYDDEDEGAGRSKAKTKRRPVF